MTYNLQYPFTPEKLRTTEFKENPNAEKDFTPAMMEEFTILANTAFCWGRKGQYDIYEKGMDAAKKYMYLFYGKPAVRLVEKWLARGYDLGET